MYTGYHTPWDHYPKYLPYKEFINPINFLSEFFNAHSLKGHRRDLTEWRHYAVSDECFHEKKFGPGQLLYTHELNVKLLEAMYVMLINYECSYPKPPSPTELQLAQEKKTLRPFPKDLSPKELLNPLKVAKKIFKDLSLPQYREHLYEWLNEALIIKHIAESMDAADVILVYENMLKLYSAAWLILHRSEKEHMESKPVKFIKTIELPQIALKPFGPKLSPAEKLGLNEVVKVILTAVPSVQLITFIGIHPKPFTYYLAIATGKSIGTTDHKNAGTADHGIEGTADQINSGAADHEIGRTIEEKCRTLVSVIPLVHSVENLKKGIYNGRRFWNLVLSKGITVYQSPELSLPEPKVPSKTIMNSRAYLNWQTWGIQGQGFLKGAEGYLADGNYRLTMFSLHQATENTLKGVLKVILGYSPASQSLSKLLRLTLLFTEDLSNVFEPETEQGKKLIGLLQSAYVETRHKQDFTPDEQSVRWLTEKVGQLLINAGAIVKQFLETINANG
jgi:HEPN domain-containing protein